jgi:UDP-N-acetyl-D-glucosamine dehydrogenase
MEAAQVATHELLAEKIRNRTASVGVIGLGYVGLPLAVEFANAGFSVTGIDLQASKVASLNAGISYIQDGAYRHCPQAHRVRSA